jgi:hypothetical protein
MGKDYQYTEPGYEHVVEDFSRIGLPGVIVISFDDGVHIGVCHEVMKPDGLHRNATKMPAQYSEKDLQEAKSSLQLWSKETD